MAIQTHTEQISSLSVQVLSIEDRFTNIARLIKLLQGSVNAQELEMKKIRAERDSKKFEEISLGEEGMTPQRIVGVEN